MIDINWDEAPEGTTHVLLGLDGNHHGYWRKVEDGQVFSILRGAWDCVDSAERWFGELGNDVVARPPKENPLPNGLQWVEGATHYNPSHGGFFFNEKEFTTNKGRSWSVMVPLGFAYWAAKDTTILRGDVAQPVVAKKPAPKKQPIGWWQ